MAIRRKVQCLVVLLVVQLGCSFGASIKAGCTLRTNPKDSSDLPSLAPLILDRAGAFKLPNPNSIVELAAGEVIRLVCAGAKVQNGVNYFTVFGNNKDNTATEVQATCVGGTVFDAKLVGGDGKVSTMAFDKLGCTQNPVRITQKTGKTCNSGKNNLIDIGYNVGTSTSPSFIDVVQVCFDEAELSATWSTVDLLKNIAGGQTGGNVPTFFTDSVYENRGVNPNPLYEPDAQIVNVGKLLGGQDQASKYIKTDKTLDLFLSRGHLSAKSDQVYWSQVRATYCYINVAPQWKSLNKYSWNFIEQNTRNLAISKSLDLVVYTGTHGITRLPDAKGKPTKIYIGVDKNGKNVIPVPAVNWKVVYDKVNKKGVAFVGVNNPHLKKAELTVDENFCAPTAPADNVCNKLGAAWGTWPDQDDQPKGFYYCCKIEDLKKTVKTLPDFDLAADSLLTGK